MLEQALQQMLMSSQTEESTRKDRLKNLMLNLIDQLPLTVQGLARVYLSSVMQSLDDMEDSTVDSIIEQARNIVDFLEGKDYGNEHDTGR